MWGNRIARFLMVALHTFVSWAVLIFVFSFVVIYPHWLLATFRIILFVVIFAVVFHHYFQSYKQTLPFFATIYALTSFVFFEMFYRIFFLTAPRSDLNFIDWILPFFAIATTIYFIGKQKKQSYDISE